MEVFLFLIIYASQRLNSFRHKLKFLIFFRFLRRFAIFCLYFFTFGAAFYLRPGTDYNSVTEEVEHFLNLAPVPCTYDVLLGFFSASRTTKLSTSQLLTPATCCTPTDRKTLSEHKQPPVMHVSIHVNKCQVVF